MQSAYNTKVDKNILFSRKKFNHTTLLLLQHYNTIGVLFKINKHTESNLTRLKFMGLHCIIISYLKTTINYCLKKSLCVKFDN